MTQKSNNESKKGAKNSPDSGIESEIQLENLQSDSDTSNDFASDMEFAEDEIYSGEATTKDKLKKLREKLKASEAEKRDNLAGWQRAKADLINFKKESEAMRPRLLDLGARGVVTDLLPAVDSFYAAMKNTVAWEKVDSNWRQGVEYIHNQLKTALEDNNVTIVEPVSGEEFDSDIHEVSGDTQPDENSVVAETKRLGFIHRDYLLRPATVSIQSGVSNQEN